MIGSSVLGFGRDAARDAVRTFNKYLLNPLMLTVAGRPHFYAAVLRHVGRRSGARYATPVVADPTATGYLVPLPYGTSVDWLLNVQAAGGATLQVHGRTVQVTAPVVLTAAEALPLLPPDRARYWRLLRMDRFLSLTTVPARPAPDLRTGDPRVHDLIAEIDEAIDAGDEPLVEALSSRLRQLAPNAGAGADT
jgi:deazaflavin-dependent oxidoreductase (nitroreductase family)